LKITGLKIDADIGRYQYSFRGSLTDQAHSPPPDIFVYQHWSDVGVVSGKGFYLLLYSIALRTLSLSIPQIALQNHSGSQ